MRTGLRLYIASANEGYGERHASKVDVRLIFEKLKLCGTYSSFCSDYSNKLRLVTYVLGKLDLFSMVFRIRSADDLDRLPSSHDLCGNGSKVNIICATKERDKTAWRCNERVVQREDIVIQTAASVP